MEHSETAAPGVPSRFVQAWLVPDEPGLPPAYGATTPAPVHLDGRAALLAAGPGVVGGEDAALRLGTTGAALQIVRLEAVGQELTEVRITDLREGVFYAELVFASGVEVSARPSDAIALALRTGTPIYGSDGVLDDAGIAIPDEQEDEVEKFREFLDTITPEDFEQES